MPGRNEGGRRRGAALSAPVLGTKSGGGKGCFAAPRTSPSGEVRRGFFVACATADRRCGKRHRFDLPALMVPPLKWCRRHVFRADPWRNDRRILVTVFFFLAVA
jgi:hypothetical protein